MLSPRMLCGWLLAAALLIGVGCLPALIGQPAAAPTLPRAAAQERATLPPRPAPTATPTPALLPFPAAQLTETLTPAGGTFGVMLYDMPSSSLRYAQNETQVFPAASLIKLPIALTIYREAEVGHLSLDEQIVLQASDIVGGTGVIQNAPPGTVYTIRELCHLMLAVSDNTATNMLIGRLGGFDPVNWFSAELGAHNTLLQRLMMDFAAREAGIDNLTSPADMLLFLQELEQGTLLSLPSRAAILASLAANQDDQKIPALLPPETLVQNKIGVLPAVEHDVALVTTPDGRCYALVLMSRDLASNAAGIRASAQASRLVFDYEQQLTLRETDTTTDEE